GRRFRHDLRADDAARAAAVLDHHRLAEVVGERRHVAARRDVGAAAGRGRHDQPDRPLRILRRGAERSERERDERCQPWHVAPLEDAVYAGRQSMPGDSRDGDHDRERTPRAERLRVTTNVRWCRLEVDGEPAYGLIEGRDVLITDRPPYDMPRKTGRR